MVSYIVVYFTLMSFVGYLYETIAMTMWSGKWQNRGFLYGPIIPIYGFGSLGTLIFINLIPDYSMWMVFMGGLIGSALLEFPTSYVLEKLFHAVWWDYSNAPYNIQGRISLFTSMGFGVAAIVIIYIINPIVLGLLDTINPTLLDIIGYLCIGIIFADTTLTVSVLGDFENKVNRIQKMIDERLDDVVDNVNPKGRNIRGALKHTKENVIDANVDRLYDSMDNVYHGAISRITEFRSSGSDTIHTIKTKIKNRIDKLRK